MGYQPHARVGAAVIAACLLAPASANAQAGSPTGDAAFDSSYFAWQAGDYPDALARISRLLAGPNADRLLESVAVLTGELFHTVELSTDGTAPRWSPDSRHVAWESGRGTERITHVAAVANGAIQPLARLTGHSAVFDGRGRVVVIAADSRLIAYDVESGRESVITRAGVTPLAVVVRPDHGTLHVLAATANDGGGHHLYRVDNGALQPVTTADGPKSNPVFLADEKLLYTIDRQSFAIQDLRTGTVMTFTGAQVVSSKDGRAVAFVRSGPDGNAITLIETANGGMTDVVRRGEPLMAPALSADGTRLAYQAMPREDWELFVVDADGSNEFRLTREIQHDVLPRFVDNDHVFALIGEPRHRRSYLYDLRTGVRTRLFHNNTVRTVAPEYEWVVSPDGRSVLVVADRDGDTVSPERGVYMMDLARRVTLVDLQRRVRDQLVAEHALRERARELFAGIENPVRAAVTDVSTDRIHQYGDDLHRFDSKHIARPGNAMAIEYLTTKLREFGYEPQVQWFEARGIRTANVIAVLRGTLHPDVLYTVSSHFDSVERGPGADDNSSGTAALLEAARVLATRPQPATIHFAFFTGEEAGLLGSREYVRRAVENGDMLVGALNNDMIGFMNDQRMDNTIRYSNAGIRDVQHGAALLFTDLITYDAKYYRSTDAHAYYEVYGDIVGGIGSYPILGNPHYHQAHDQIETVSHQLIAEVSKTTVATLMQMANVPSRVKNVRVSRARGATTVAWNALPEADVTGYVVEWRRAGETEPAGSVRVTGTTATLPLVDAAAGATVAAGDNQADAAVAGAVEIRVSGINSRGAMSWDRAVAFSP